MPASGLVKDEDAAGHDAKGKDPNRFYCPFPGCNRSFAELWRLKVHYRAPPDVRGSGKERGHGTELKFCPKCQKELKAGKHHVGCSAGRANGRQSSKRKADTEPELDVTAAPHNGHISAFSFGPGMHDFTFDNEDMFGTNFMGGQPQQPMTLVMPQLQQQHNVMGQAASLMGTHPSPFGAMPLHNEAGLQPNGLPSSMQQHSQGLGEGSQGQGTQVLLGPQGCDHSLPGYQQHTSNSGDAMLIGAASLNGHSMRQDSVPCGAVAGAMGPAGLQNGLSNTNGNLISSWPGFCSDSQPFFVPDVAANGTHDDDLTSDLLPPALSPSPPPLPPDWDTSVKPSGLLFDFDSFNAAKKKDVPTNGRPYITITSSMNPADMACPSDDYIMQILFGDANEPVPRRMTTHLHHFESFDDGLTDFDKDPEPHESLDDLLAKATDMSAMDQGGVSGPSFLGGSKEDLYGTASSPLQQQMQPQPVQMGMDHKGVPLGGCDVHTNGVLPLPSEGHVLSVQQS